MKSFDQVLKTSDLALRRTLARVLQINVGKLCNMACIHCHVEAGPGRNEIMTPEVADRIIGWMQRHRPKCVDITGGAPEMCSEFRRLVSAAKEAGAHVMVRCNLTVIFEPGQTDLPEFYRDHELELIASLPCYLEENVDRQRGVRSSARGEDNVLNGFATDRPLGEEADRPSLVQDVVDAAGGGFR